MVEQLRDAFLPVIVPLLVVPVEQVGVVEHLVVFRPLPQVVIDIGDEAVGEGGHLVVRRQDLDNVVQAHEGIEDEEIHQIQPGPDVAASLEELFIVTFAFSLLQIAVQTLDEVRVVLPLIVKALHTFAEIHHHVLFQQIHQDDAVQHRLGVVLFHLGLEGPFVPQGGCHAVVHGDDVILGITARKLIKEHFAPDERQEEGLHVGELGQFGQVDLVGVLEVEHPLGLVDFHHIEIVVLTADHLGGVHEQVIQQGGQRLDLRLQFYGQRIGQLLERSILFHLQLLLYRDDGQVIFNHPCDAEEAMGRLLVHRGYLVIAAGGPIIQEDSVQFPDRFDIIYIPVDLNFSVLFIDNSLRQFGQQCERILRNLVQFEGPVFCFLLVRASAGKHQVAQLLRGIGQGGDMLSPQIAKMFVRRLLEQGDDLALISLNAFTKDLLKQNPQAPVGVLAGIAREPVPGRGQFVPAIGAILQPRPENIEVRQSLFVEILKITIDITRRFTCLGKIREMIKFLVLVPDLQLSVIIESNFQVFEKSAHFILDGDDIGLGPFVLLLQLVAVIVQEGENIHIEHIQQRREILDGGRGHIVVLVVQDGRQLGEEIDGQDELLVVVGRAVQGDEIRLRRIDAGLGDAADAHLLDHEQLRDERLVDVLHILEGGQVEQDVALLRGVIGRQGRDGLVGINAELGNEFRALLDVLHQAGLELPTEFVLVIRAEDGLDCFLVRIDDLLGAPVFRPAHRIVEPQLPLVEPAEVNQLIDNLSIHHEGVLERAPVLIGNADLEAALQVRDEVAGLDFVHRHALDGAAVLVDGAIVVFLGEIDVAQILVQALQDRVVAFFVTQIPSEVHIMPEEARVVALDGLRLVQGEVEDGRRFLGGLGQRGDLLGNLLVELVLEQARRDLRHVGLEEEFHDGGHRVAEFRILVHVQQFGHLLQVAPGEALAVVLVDLVQHEGGRDEQLVAIVAHLVRDGVHHGRGEVVDEVDELLVLQVEVQDALLPDVLLRGLAHDDFVVPVELADRVVVQLHVLLEVGGDLLRGAVADMGQKHREAAEELHHVADFILLLPGLLIGHHVLVLDHVQIHQVLVVPAEAGQFVLEDPVVQDIFLHPFPEVFQRKEHRGQIHFGHRTHVRLVAFRREEAAHVQDAVEDTTDGEFAVGEVGQGGVEQLVARYEHALGLHGGDEQFHIGQQAQHILFPFFEGGGVGEALDGGVELRRGFFVGGTVAVRLRAVAGDLVQFVEHEDELHAVFLGAIRTVDVVDDAQQFLFQLAHGRLGRGLALSFLAEGEVEQAAAVLGMRAQLFAESGGDPVAKGFQPFQGAIRHRIERHVLAQGLSDADGHEVEQDEDGQAGGITEELSLVQQIVHPDQDALEEGREPGHFIEILEASDQSVAQFGQGGIEHKTCHEEDRGADAGEEEIAEYRAVLAVVDKLGISFPHVLRDQAQDVTFVQDFLAQVDRDGNGGVIPVPAVPQFQPHLGEHVPGKQVVHRQAPEAQFIQHIIPPFAQFQQCDQEEGAAKQGIGERIGVVPPYAVEVMFRGRPDTPGETEEAGRDGQDHRHLEQDFLVGLGLAGDQFDDPLHQQGLAHPAVSRDQVRTGLRLAGEPGVQLAHLDFAADELVLGLGLMPLIVAVPVIVLVVVTKSEIRDENLQVPLRRSELEELSVAYVLRLLRHYLLFHDGKTMWFETQ